MGSNPHTDHPKTAFYRTPRTTLTWSNLAQWHVAALALDARHSSQLNRRRIELHVAALPVSLINACDDASVLAACRDLLRAGPFGQPPRGQRHQSPHTPLIVAINNRLARIPPQS